MVVFRICVIPLIMYKVGMAHAQSLRLRVCRNVYYLYTMTNSVSVMFIYTSISELLVLR